MTRPRTNQSSRWTAHRGFTIFTNLKILKLPVSFSSVIGYLLTGRRSGSRVDTIINKASWEPLVNDSRERESTGKSSLCSKPGFWISIQRWKRSSIIVSSDFNRYLEVVDGRMISKQVHNYLTVLQVKHASTPQMRPRETRKSTLVFHCIQWSVWILFEREYQACLNWWCLLIEYQLSTTVGIQH